jgi:hypothetical protein
VSAVPEIQIAELDPTVAVQAVAGATQESKPDEFQPRDRDGAAPQIGRVTTLN